MLIAYDYPWPLFHVFNWQLDKNLAVGLIYVSRYEMGSAFSCVCERIKCAFLGIGNATYTYLDGMFGRLFHDTPHYLISKESKIDPMTRMPGLLKLRYCWWKKSCTTWHIYNLVKKRDKLPINWGRISSINGSTRKISLGGLVSFLKLLFRQLRAVNFRECKTHH